MTSVLNVDEIAAKNGTGPVTLTKQSPAKAWARFSQSVSGHTPDDSFGISSTADGGTGDTNITMTNSMSSIHYAVSFNASQHHFRNDADHTTSVFQGKATSSSHTNIDSVRCSAIAYGDLA